MLAVLAVAAVMFVVFNLELWQDFRSSNTTTEEN